MLVKIEPWQSLDGLARAQGVTECKTRIMVTTTNEQSSSASLPAYPSMKLKTSIFPTLNQVSV